MPALRRLIAVLLLSIWLPATLHCALESAGLHLPLLCHGHEAAEVAETHCAGDDCHALDHSSFTSFAITKLVASISLPIVATLTAPLDLPTAGISSPAAAPPEVARSWIFVERAALPPRAP
ncbi:MAG: hypothetical protein JNL39_09745 [Opitutaceae bacterium]|nr:hypothetical protein [Opitutaceae bacterium]